MLPIQELGVTSSDGSVSRGRKEVVEPAAELDVAPDAQLSQQHGLVAGRLARTHRQPRGGIHLVDDVCVAVDPPDHDAALAVTDRHCEYPTAPSIQVELVHGLDV